MVEHIERYEEFAGYLAEYGIVTVGNDHLGHGKSVASTEDWGFFAEEEGNRAVIQDMHTLQKKMMLEYPRCRIFFWATAWAPSWQDSICAVMEQN